MPPFMSSSVTSADAPNPGVLPSPIMISIFCGSTYPAPATSIHSLVSGALFEFTGVPPTSLNLSPTLYPCPAPPSVIVSVGRNIASLGKSLSWSTPGSTNPAPDKYCSRYVGLFQAFLSKFTSTSLPVPGKSLSVNGILMFTFSPPCGPKLPAGINVLDMVLVFSKPRLTWKSPTCWNKPPPQPLATVQGLSLQLLMTKRLMVVPSWYVLSVSSAMIAFTPNLPQLICVLISSSVLPFLNTILRSLMYSSDPSAMLLA